MAAVEIPQGYFGNLMPLQQRRLHEFWARLTDITGVQQQYAQAAAETTENGTAAPSGAASVPSAAAASNNEAHDKYGQSEAFTSYLANETPSSIHRAFWAAIKNDNPDSLALRFLRARKWDVDKAIVMLVTMIQWREQQDINNIVVRGGEGVGLKEKRNEDEEGLLLQYRLGKSYVRGLDVNNRPVYIVKPRLHSQKTQTDRAMELYILHTIESIRMLVKDPFDTACLIFDLTGFGLKNMDFPAVKFLIQVFEARYPETLGVVLIHNAPWVFQGIWRIVKGWLDPVVAAKINFTSKPSDLEQFIPKENLTTEFGGLDDYTYAYIEPKAGENDAMQDTERIDQLTAEREAIIAEYDKATVEWCAMAFPPVPSTTNGTTTSTTTTTATATTAVGEGVTNGAEKPNDGETAETTLQRQRDEKYAARTAIAEKLAANYWLLDRHVRARNIYDRLGILSETGEVNFAPKK